MDIIIEIVKIVLPAALTGLFSFFITKYKYNRDIPLDNLKIAYNRIYYPLYKIITDKNVDIDKVIRAGEVYLAKYEKYADISTKRLFLQLKEYKKEMERELRYQSFKENINDRNSFLRRRLGYLEPSFVQIYKYSTPSVKWQFRIFIYFLVLYLAALVYGFTTNRLSIICQISMLILGVAFVLIILDTIWFILSHLLHKIFFGIKEKIRK